jgi:general transcription factor 3C polypeptide 3 (transcription factor C subunit 4)
MQTAACYRMLGDLKEAAELYDHSKYSGEVSYTPSVPHLLRSFVSVKSADPTNNEAKMNLAEIYEILNEPRKALELVYEGNLSTSLRFLSTIVLTF